MRRSLAEWSRLVRKLDEPQRWSLLDHINATVPGPPHVRWKCVCDSCCKTALYTLPAERQAVAWRELGGK